MNRSFIECYVKELDTITGKYLKNYKIDFDNIISASSSEDKQKVILINKDGKMKELDIITGEFKTSEVRIDNNLLTEDNILLSDTLSVIPDRKRFVVGNNETIEEYDLTAMNSLKKIHGYSGSIKWVNYSSDSERIIYKGYDDVSKEWDLQNDKYLGICYKRYNQLLYKITDNTVNDLKHIIADDNKFNVIKSLLNTLFLEIELIEILKSLSFNKQEIELILYNAHNPIYYLYKCMNDNGDEVEFIDDDFYGLDNYYMKNEITNLIYNSSRKTMCGILDNLIIEREINTSRYCNIIIRCEDKDFRCNFVYFSTPKFYHNHSHKESIKNHRRNIDAVLSINYSLDGEKILSGCADNTIKEWDVLTQECIKAYEGHTGAVLSVNYSPDGEKILSGSADKTIKEWDVRTGECLKTYHGHTYAVNSVCYSPDGRRILSGSDDNTIREWNICNGECLHIVQPIPGLSISGVDMSELHPDSEINDEERKLLKQYGAIL